MNITRHAKKRYRERINSDTENIEQEIIDCYEKAVAVYEEGVNGDSKEFLVHENVLFVYTPVTDTIITVIDINFGFSESVNMELCRLQLERVLSLKERLSSEKSKASKVYEKFDKKITVIDGEIDLLQKKLEAIQAKRELILASKTKIFKNVQSTEKEYIAEAKRLVYSTSFRVEELNVKHA
ncbi:hypothetical protein DCCM_3232 [Desulfocucumis palustris]|uniref:Uncharacterized protein n=1 Tax=Desulfocucumis palustris TaxID=1898651 RepID=A0A2L2XD86_9FIRM|nr:hypothetical protein [Desulfocucumis palustris]GBF34120.1 hypothetical protein DCCM_3232 [Desulfocucumis palustris]